VRFFRSSFSSSIADFSSDTGSLRVVWILVEPLLVFENFDASRGISGVVAVNSQRDVYASYLS
jgi:hypothetical protein